MSEANFGRCTSISEDELSSRPISSNASFFAHRLPGAGLRLTPEEWALIVGALGAYRHNNAYRPLYEKFAAESSGMLTGETCAGRPGSRLRLNPEVPSRR